MHETAWKVMGLFIFFYVGIANAALLVFLVVRKLYISRLDLQIIMRKHKIQLLEFSLISLIGLSVGFMVYTSAEILARAYGCWLSYTIIIVILYITYRYRFWSFLSHLRH